MTQVPTSPDRTTKPAAAALPAGMARAYGGLDSPADRGVGGDAATLMRILRLAMRHRGRGSYI